jgi:hypothetical protein
MIASQIMIVIELLSSVVKLIEFSTYCLLFLDSEQVAILYDGGIFEAALENAQRLAYQSSSRVVFETSSFRLGQFPVSLGV